MLELMGSGYSISRLAFGGNYLGMSGEQLRVAAMVITGIRIVFAILDTGSTNVRARPSRARFRRVEICEDACCTGDHSDRVPRGHIAARADIPGVKQ